MRLAALGNGHHGRLGPDVDGLGPVEAVEAAALDGDDVLAGGGVQQAGAAEFAKVAKESLPGRCWAAVAADTFVVGDGKAREDGTGAKGRRGLAAAVVAVADVEGEGLGRWGCEDDGAALAAGFHFVETLTSQRCE